MPFSIEDITNFDKGWVELDADSYLNKLSSTTMIIGLLSGGIENGKNTKKRLEH